MCPAGGKHVTHPMTPMSETSPVAFTSAPASISRRDASTCAAAKNRPVALCPSSRTSINVGSLASQRDCFTEKVCPAIVAEPLRFFGLPVYGATVYVTVPLPVPGEPPAIVTVIHVALGVAVHVQPVGAVTATLPVPPDAPRVVLVGEIA